MKKLRDWQTQAFEALQMRVNDRPVVRAVMGAGKSILLAEVVKNRLQAPAYGPAEVIVTAPTQKLVDQLSETIEWWAGCKVGKWYAHSHQLRRVVVACQDSLGSLADELDKHRARVMLWIADEAHRTETDECIAAIARINPVERVGFTATPWRAEEHESISLFDVLAYDYSPQQAMRDGVVVRPIIEHYTGSAETIDDACVEMIRGADGPGIVNASSITDADEFAARLNDEGIRSAAIHSRVSRDEQSALLGELHHGDLKCIVHVNMLSEGVDLPWLMWLCCRRPVRSRVRFAQEVGRVLRAHPGKKFATVYDPHDLWNTLRLDYDAVLSGGEGEDTPAEEAAALEIDFFLGQVKARKAHNMEVETTLSGVPIQLLKPIRSYLRTTALMLEFAGLYESKISSTSWRSHPASEKQLAVVGGVSRVLGNVSLPSRHATALDCAVHAAHELTKGDVADLITILTVLRRERQWPQIDAEVAA